MVVGICDLWMSPVMQTACIAFNCCELLQEKHLKQRRKKNKKKDINGWQESPSGSIGFNY